jgi:uncharacterized membrane protein
MSYKRTIYSLIPFKKLFDIQSYSAVGSIISRFKVRRQTERILLRKVEGIRKDFMRQGQTCFLFTFASSWFKRSFDSSNEAVNLNERQRGKYYENIN